jgi:UDP:flavonoid glycosyltransferase YjiC (YdhE family)
MPKRIVINCWGSHGDLFPYVGLAIALKERGHAPVVATAAIYRDEVESAGVEYAHVGPDLDPNDETLYERVMHPIKGSEVIVRELLMPKLAETHAQLRDVAAGADLLVAHPLTVSVPLVAEKMNVPWVSTVLAPMLFFSVTDLPVLPQLPLLRHASKLGVWGARAVVRLGHASTEAWFEPVHRLRAELGLPPAGHPMFEGLFSPHLTLALFSRVLAEPQPDWPPNVRTTGFVFYNGPDPTLSPELEAFLAAGPPPVVFTLGTSAVGAAGRFYHESAAAAARLGVRAVLLTGGFERNRPAPELLSDNVLLVDRAPHQLLFPRASAIVHQGGIGTTGQALRSGRPMLVVPHGHDQPDNAYRVTKLGVARTLYPRRYRAARVARELARLLGAEYAPRTEAVGSAVRAEDGAAEAAEALEVLPARAKA